MLDHVESLIQFFSLLRNIDSKNPEEEVKKETGDFEADLNPSEEKKKKSTESF